MGISELIREAGVFFKVTGRYPVYNIRHFVDKAFTFLSRDIQLMAMRKGTAKV